MSNSSRRRPGGLVFFFALPTRAIPNARRKLSLCAGFRVFQLTPSQKIRPLSRQHSVRHEAKHWFQEFPRTFRHFRGLSDLILGGFYFRADPNINPGTSEEGKNESTARGSRRPNCIQDQALEDHRTQFRGVRRILGYSGSEKLLATVRPIS
jgi:hypothetical protein